MLQYSASSSWTGGRGVTLIAVGQARVGPGSNVVPSRSDCCEHCVTASASWAAFSPRGRIFSRRKACRRKFSAFRVNGPAIRFARLCRIVADAPPLFAFAVAATGTISARNAIWFLAGRAHIHIWHCSRDCSYDWRAKPFAQLFQSLRADVIGTDAAVICNTGRAYRSIRAPAGRGPRSAPRAMISNKHGSSFAPGGSIAQSCFALSIRLTRRHDKGAEFRTCRIKNDSAGVFFPNRGMLSLNIMTSSKLRIRTALPKLRSAANKRFAFNLHPAGDMETSKTIFIESPESISAVISPRRDIVGWHSQLRLLCRSRPESWCILCRDTVRSLLKLKTRFPTWRRRAQQAIGFAPEFVTRRLIRGHGEKLCRARSYASLSGASFVRGWFSVPPAKDAVGLARLAWIQFLAGCLWASRREWSREIRFTAEGRDVDCWRPSDGEGQMRFRVYDLVAAQFSEPTIGCKQGRWGNHAE